MNSAKMKVLLNNLSNDTLLNIHEDLLKSRGYSEEVKLIEEFVRLLEYEIEVSREIDLNKKIQL